MLKFITRKFKSALFYLKHHKKNRMDVFNKKKLFLKIVYDYRFLGSKQRVAIGTTFNPKGGVANHILALHKYLKTSNSIIPSYNDSISLSKKSAYHQFRIWVDKHNFVHNNILHSHADPWFINYCYKQKKRASCKMDTYLSFALF